MIHILKVLPFLPNCAFVPCDHGLDFFTSTYYVNISNQSTNHQSIKWRELVSSRRMS